MSESLRDLQEYITRLSGDRQKFVDDNPWPFLVRLPATLPEEVNPWEDDFAYNTQVPGIDLDDEEEDERPSHAVVLQPVRKRPGGPFPMRIGVGRTRNCDVVLRFASVSKLHAQFHVETTPWQLVDLDSANGTFVNDERLAPRQPRAIAIDDRLRFGAVEAQLMSAGALFDTLRAMRA
jgi:hypothetical protein